MPTTIVVGGQYGSEGKGKVVALLASRTPNPWLVRCGGPNSGHTVTIRDQDTILRQVPSCSEPDKATYFISAGCVVDEAVIACELDLLGIPRDRIFVDPRAVVVTEEDRAVERRDLYGIASTCSGTGAALIRRMFRQADTKLAQDSQLLRSRCRVESVAALLHDGRNEHREIIVEGTQGFGLSILHSPDYPYVTSRDTTAAGFATEVGLSPRAIDRIVMVIRTFPIRVGGRSGPLKRETTWDAVSHAAGAPEVIPEYTSVTKRLRRVAHFDLDAVTVASRYNLPTSIAIMGLDRLDHANTGVTCFNDLTPKAQRFVRQVECATEIPAQFLGTGFATFNAVDMTILRTALEATNG